MIRTSLGSRDISGVASAYNTVYTGYFMPFNVNEHWAEQLVLRQAIDLAHSPLWLDELGEIIGMAALGVRGTRGWVGGFGISPAYRGRGLSHKLALELVAIARSIGLRQIALEVIAQNTPAIRTYLRTGFHHTRDLLILTRSGVAERFQSSPGLVDADASPHLLIARSQLPAVPAWQRDPAGIANIHGLRSLKLGSDDEPRAIAFYVMAGASISIIDVAASDEADAGKLADALVEIAPDQRLTVINEPEESPLIPALLERGWTETMRQHEMTIYFN